MSRPRRTRDAGESLIEIVLTVVIIGVAITALVSGLATSASAGTTTRATVGADAVMRNFAESVKLAAASCTEGAPISVTFAPPSGYTTTSTPAVPLCPPVTSTGRVTLDVTGPNGVVQTMQIVVRTP